MFRKVLLGTLLVAVLVPTVASASYESYTGYTLKKLKANNYTNVHDKVTSKDYIRNHVIEFEDTTKAKFWAADADENALSRKYGQSEGNTTTIKFYDDVNLDAGDQVSMGMENAFSRPYYAFVAGEVDFK